MADDTPYIAIQIPMMPKDTNRHGTILGCGGWQHGRKSLQPGSQ